jgi:hypothetical protein
LPGELPVEAEVPAIIAGTLESCLLEEVDDRWSSNDDDMESDNCAFVSLMFWNFESAAVVRRIVASRAAESLREKLFRSFFCSRNRIKSFRFSSSVCCADPDALPSARPSFMTSDPGWADEAALPLPLLLSSSPLLAPPDENLLLRWLKLLL